MRWSADRTADALADPQLGTVSYAANETLVSDDASSSPDSI